MGIFINYPLVAALASILLAQFIKVPLNFSTKRSWNWGLAFSTGGMPSSHSAAVTSLSTAVGKFITDYLRFHLQFLWSSVQ